MIMIASYLKEIIGLLKEIKQELQSLKRWH